MIAQKYISRESYPLVGFQGSFRPAFLQHSAPLDAMNLLEKGEVASSHEVCSQLILSGRYRGMSLRVPQNLSSPPQRHTLIQFDCIILLESRDQKEAK